MKKAKFPKFGVKKANLATTPHTHWQVSHRAPILRNRKTKVRHKFHQRAMLTTSDVTEKKFLQHPQKLAGCSGTHEKANVLGRLTGPWKPTVNGHFSGPSHLYNKIYINENTYSNRIVAL